MTIIWCMIPEISSATDRIFCYFGQFFAHLPLKTPKIKTLKKWKKSLKIFFILHKCTKNQDHMLYFSWDMSHDICSCYFSFWTILALLPPNSPKNENFKKMKKHLEMSSFYTSLPKIVIICYTIPEIWYITWQM